MPRNIGDLERDLFMARQSGHRLKQLQLLRELSLLFSQQDMLDKTINCEQQALDLAQSLGRQRDQIAILNSIGTAHLVLEQPDESLSALKSAMGTARSLNLPGWMAQIQLNIARATSLKSEPDAVEAYQQALQSARAADDTDLEVATLQEMAALGQQLGRKELLIPSLRDALAIVERRGAMPHVAALAMSLGLAHAAAGEYDEAIPAFEQAAEAFQEIDNREEAARAYGNLGTAHLRRDDPAAARAAFTRTYDLFKALNDEENITRIVGMLAEIDDDEPAA